MTATSFLIRQAEEKDTATIVDFNASMALETEDLSLDRNVLEKGVQSVFKNPEYGVYYVAENEGKVVACLLITLEWSDWRNGMLWWIQSVYVRPQFRRKGVFKALFQFVENLVAEKKNVAGLRLYVEHENETAQKTYEHLGMVKTGYRLYEKLSKNHGA